MADNSSQPHVSTGDAHPQRDTPSPQQSTASSNLRDGDRLQAGLDGAQSAPQTQGSKPADRRGMITIKDISTGKDADHIIVSTTGDGISAERVAASARSRLWMGQIPDSVLLQLDQNYRQSTRAVQQHKAKDANFEEVHGRGRRLDS